MADTHITKRMMFENIVAGVLRMAHDYSVYSRYKPFIEPELFYANDNSEPRVALRFLLSLINELSLTEEDRKKFTPRGIAVEIKNKERDISKGEKYLAIYETWLEDPLVVSNMADEGAWSVFLEYLKLLQIHKVAGDFQKNMNTHRIEKAMSIMSDAIHDAGKITTTNSTALLKDEVKDFILNASEHKKRYLDLGCSFLDKYIGGYEQGTLNGFLSFTGGGKTMFSHHLGVRAIMTQSPAWIGVTEDRKNSYILKVCAALTGIPINTLREARTGNYRLSAKDIQKIEKANDLINKYLRVEFIYGHDVDYVHKIEREYDIWCEKKGLVIPIISIVDYTGHNSALSAGDKMYEKMRTAYAARKNFCLKYDKIGFDFAQINRDGTKNMKHGNNLITQADLSGSYDIAQVFDNLMSINRTDEEMDMDLCTLYVCKARDAGTGVQVQVKVDFSCARYYMDQWSLLGGGGAKASKLSQELKQQERQHEDERSKLDDTTSRRQAEENTGNVIGISKRT